MNANPSILSSLGVLSAQSVQGRLPKWIYRLKEGDYKLLNALPRPGFVHDGGFAGLCVPLGLDADDLVLRTGVSTGNWSDPGSVLEVEGRRPICGHCYPCFNGPAAEPLSC